MSRIRYDGEIDRRSITSGRNFAGCIHHGSTPCTVGVFQTRHHSGSWLPRPSLVKACRTEASAISFIKMQGHLFPDDSLAVYHLARYASGTIKEYPAIGAKPLLID